MIATTSQRPAHSPGSERGTPVEGERAARRSTLAALVRDLFQAQSTLAAASRALVTIMRASASDAVATTVARIDAPRDLSREDLDLIAAAMEEYQLFASSVVRVRIDVWRAELARRSMLISSVEKVIAVEIYGEARNLERRLSHTVSVKVQEFSIWTSFLKDVGGVSMPVAAVLVAAFDPYQAAQLSGFWKFAGLDGGRGGRNRSGQRPPGRPVTTDAQRMRAIDPSVIKSVLLGQLGPALIKQCGVYRAQYETYKVRLGARDDVGLVAQAAGVPGATAAHRHAMATRYMVKMFLGDLWRTWRILEGLSVGIPYVEGRDDARGAQSTT